MASNMEYIERKIDVRVPYRVGYPLLPILPVDTKEDKTLFTSDVLLRVEEILQEHDIGGRMVPAYRFNRGQTLHPTLTIIADCSPSMGNAHWIQAVESIRDHFISKNLNAAIEIIDCVAYLGGVTQPVEAHEYDLAGKWKDFYPTLESTIEKHQWATIDVLYRGVRDDLCSPTIVITALDANSKAWWTETLPAIRQMVPSEFQVELMFGGDIFTTSVVGTTAPYDSLLPMGSSCGIAGSDSAGTLGGPVTLLKDGLQLGLTNHHVLSNDTIGTKFQGLSRPFEVTVVAPSDKDHREFKEQIEARGQFYKNKIANCDDSLSGARQARAMKGLQRQNDADMATVQSSNRELGAVVASSGLRSALYDEDTGGIAGSSGALKWALDWSLVLPTPERDFSAIITNVLSSFDLSDPSDALEYRKINGTTNLKVAKNGRSTGWTKGLVSKIPSTVNLRNILAAPGSPITVTNLAHHKDPVLCYAVTDSETRSFSADGDSGSLVLLDQAGETAIIVGLAFAANSPIGVSYMTPMRVVIKDIENVTGLPLHYPYYGGEVRSQF